MGQSENRATSQEASKAVHVKEMVLVGELVRSGHI